VERELLFTGIGGQGVQLAAEVVAGAAASEGRFVSLLGLYGGMMRGGNTDSTVIVADAPVESPPLVSHAWAAVAMHDAHWATIASKVRPGGIVAINPSTFAAALPPGVEALTIPATALAASVDHPLGAALAMVGAFCAVTGLVTTESLVAAMRDAIPSYRMQHIAANEAAIRAGAAHCHSVLHRAWPTIAVGS
jgi:Pyruvate/2-oxoacid:ferredoxin oxidoreductase gamma subunit